MKNKLLSKNYILIVVSATFFYIASFMLNTVCVKHITDGGDSQSMAGIVAAVFTLASFFTRPLWGWVTDKKGRKLVYITGGMLSIASVGILFISTGVVMLTISRILFGAGYSAVTTSGGTVVCDVVPKEDMQQGIAIYGVTNVLSQAVAPVVALWLYKLGFFWIVLAVTVICAIALLTALFIKYSEQQFINPDRKFMLYEKSAMPAAYVIIFFAMATASVNSFIPIMASKRHLTADSLFFLVSALFLFLARLVNKKITYTIGNIKTFCLGAVVYITSFLILSFACNNIFLLLSAALYGCGAGFIHPVVNTAAVKSCTDSARGIATGTFMMSQDLGMATGAFIWGVISQNSGFAVVYLSVVVLLVFMTWVFRKVLSPQLADKI